MDIVRATGVEVHAVIKANAYGLGAKAVAEAIGDVVDGFCLFGLAEARELNLWELTGKPTLCLGPPGDAGDEDFLSFHARPAVSTIDEARRLRRAKPALCVDTGMQRFACPPENVAAALDAGQCTEAFTHATKPDHVTRLIKIVGGRSCGLKLHAAASNLLNHPASRLDAVRPGLALYRGAVRIAAPLVEVHHSRGPTGYGGFLALHHGVILVGYSHGLRTGPCLLNGRRTRILEVGMQSAYIETTAEDRVGDEVVLIGDGLEADEIRRDWDASPQHVLLGLLK